MTFRYMVLVAALACGVYMAERIRRRHKHDRQFHWRQMMVATETIPLFLVGFTPQSMNITANITVSLVCAMRVNAFRRIKGSPYATTMRIGSLRSGMEHFYTYRHTESPESHNQCVRYYGVIVIFLVGVVLRAVFTARLAEKAIQIGCGLLLTSLLIMSL